ncbi:MAG: hypothetical protein A3G32_09065 [Deltaproteobacteria bacterium RIFCSPLOWO2_12_FULL_40_28]|nr:MAG: hypothetical protein A3C45_07920 [Deltaproteobacteria bacterium RIFCSPHIGHO2_02_FULL_40_28]OGQ21170.1 MAG: hypothetical protein A3E27_01555 [Deltaproteobacteria bacterium RIFCSPHIGHO2_12_FULL_40_32]OGQ39071.1 MAG: hypothetical protein A3I69_09190 [Deltaproteobacteria bacterium RIFCSPLOWO2_02_FULL_40_36]OGQ53144.1 MAG: hypothetical protein A3G32_09065 [Deltaproteobacteria bacterium RIFCSPLOWO2_12_FULL_40_28]
MKKHISQLIFLLVGMMIFISCDLGHQKPKSSQKTIEMDFKRYKDAKKDLSVELPKTWEVHIIKSEEKGDQKPFRLVMEAISPKESEADPYQEKIGIVIAEKASKLPEQESQESSLAWQSSGLPATSTAPPQSSEPGGSDHPKPPSVLQGSGMTRINGSQVRWFVSKPYLSHDAGVVLQQMGYEIPTLNHVYKFGWVGESGRAAKAKNILMHAVKSFRIED